MKENYADALLRDALRLQLVATRQRYRELCVAGPNIARDEAEAVKAMRPKRTVMSLAVERAFR